MFQVVDWCSEETNTTDLTPLMFLLPAIQILTSVDAERTTFIESNGVVVISVSNFQHHFSFFLSATQTYVAIGKSCCRKRKILVLARQCGERCRSTQFWSYHTSWIVGHNSWHIR
jgi:uncharacterized protein YkuJ